MEDYSFFEIVFNLLDNVIYIVKDLLVCESQYIVAHLLEEFGPRCIIFFLLPFGMIGAINFNDQAFTARKEIDNIIANDVLTKEFNA